MMVVVVVVIDLLGGLFQARRVLGLTRVFAGIGLRRVECVGSYWFGDGCEREAEVEAVVVDSH
jgi:hypothetical protein